MFRAFRKIEIVSIEETIWLEASHIFYIKQFQGSQL